MQSNPRRNAESNFITLLNFIADPAIIVDGKGRFLVVNDAFTDLTGLKKNELIGTAFVNLNVLSAETKALLFENLVKRMKGTTVEPYEISFENQAGEIRFAEVKAKKVTYSGHTADLVVFHDITRRKENTRRLKEYSDKMAALVDEKAREIKESKEKLEKVFDSSPDAIVATDLEGKLVEVNEATVHMYECSSKDELIGKNTLDLVPQKERQKLLQLFETLSKDGAVKNVEHVSLTKQNRIFPVEFSASVLKDSFDNPIGFMGVIKDISERKKAEARRVASEKKYRRLFKELKVADKQLLDERNRVQNYLDIAEVMLVALDREGRITMLNRKGCEILKCTAEEALGKNWFDNFVPPSNRDKVKAYFRLMLSGKANLPQYYENPVLAKNRDLRLIGWHNTLLRNESGRIIGTLSSGEDITEQKKMETEIQNLAKFPAENPNPILRLNKEGTLLYANEASRALLQHMKCKVDKTAPKFLRDSVSEVLTNQFDKNFETTLGYKTWSFLIAYIKDHDYVNVYARDITEQKRSQQALVDSEEKFRSIVENSSDVVMLTLPDGTISYMSPACSMVLGYDPEDLVGTRPSIFHPDDLQLVNKTLLKALKGEKGAAFEYRIITKAGETRWISHSWSPILEKGQVKLMVSIIRNITERKKAEAELSESEDKYRTLVEHSLQGILISQFSPFRFVFANQSMANMLGYTFDELTSLSPEEIKGSIHPADLSFVLKSFRKGLLERKAPQRFEFRMIKKNGDVCWVEAFCALTAYAGEPAVQTIFVDITERKHLEKALRESEEMFRAISTSATDAIILLDDTSKITYWNPSAERIMGYANEEAVGKQLDEIIIPERRRGLHTKAALQTFENGQRHRPIESSALRKDGTEIPIELSVAVLDIRNRKHLLGIIRDISERKKMETTLREAEQRYHALFDKAPLGILVVDETATAVEFNDEAHHQLGYTREEFAKLQVYDYEAIETPEETRARMKKIMREGRDEFETKHRTKNGEIRDVIVTAQLIELAGKKLFHLITRDITEQKKVEHELEIEKDKLEAVTENIGAGLGIISKDYHILWANKLLKQINGECEGKTCYSTFNKRITVCPDCGVKKIFEEGVPIDVHEYSSEDDKGNKLWIELIVTPIKDEKGNVTAALELAVNVTERKIMQNKLAEYSQKLEKTVEKRTAQLKQTQAKLVKSERLATIGELAAMVGHDLRNPLTGIMGAAYYLKTKHSKEIGAKGQEMLETLENAIKYSNKIVNDLLEYSRDLKLDFTETTPKEILKKALSLMTVPEKTQVVDATENKPIIKADTEKMRRVFVNIIKNAFDAMPEGGTLKIKSREVKGKLEIIFKDTGTGMAKETLSKLKGGVPLFTTKAKGMGFGVPICKRIVEAHGGRICVESKAGKGTMVTVTIPVKPKPVNEGGEFFVFSKSVLSAIPATRQKHKR